jgi:hypothetical protein
MRPEYRDGDRKPSRTNRNVRTIWIGFAGRALVDDYDGIEKDCEPAIAIEIAAFVHEIVIVLVVVDHRDDLVRALVHVLDLDHGLDLFDRESRRDVRYVLCVCSAPVVSADRTFHE